MKILGIESSCDETAAAVVEDGYLLLSNVVASSIDLHKAFGGVVPEIAARSHIEVINSVIQEALDQANCCWQDISAIAVTYGPGLGGSLLIGVMTARTLAITKKLPLYACNHVLGHIYANFLTETSLPNYTMVNKPIKFPLLAIVVSGGHTQLVLFNDYFDYQLLGKTQDDAIGEAYDKVSKVLGLGYPGGPAIEIAAKYGDPLAFNFPLAKVAGYDFSFSGLKTAVLRQAQSLAGVYYDFPSFKLAERLNKAQVANLAASFSKTACEMIVTKVVKAIEEYQPKVVCLAGGVAASSELRRQLLSVIDRPLLMLDIKLCTDNAAMIATLGYFIKFNNQPSADPYSLDIDPNLAI